MSTFADLLPRDLPEQTHAGLQALADAGDARRTELGAQLAAQPPQWAREALGPVPDDLAERVMWQDKAGRAAAYREWVGHDDAADPLGPAPAAGLAEKHALYRDAHAALDLPDAGADEEQASEGLLRARVAAWEREQRWAPRYVADELDATHEALRERQSDATLYAAHADAATDPDEAGQLRAAAADARGEAERLAELLPKLEEVDAARAAWTTETAVTRDKGERGRALGLRGIDLDAPYDMVTAQDWIDAEKADRLADDEHRPITESDLHEHARDELDHARPGEDETHRDEPTPERSHEPPERQERQRDHDPVSEPVPADIRETSTADPSERADPERRRRVPLPDETDTTLDRAHLAVDEIDARHRAEAAHARNDLTAAELDDDTRLDELHRWADPEDSVAGSDDRSAPGNDDEPVLDRGFPGE